jgi:hypothetical protein
MSISGTANSTTTTNRRRRVLNRRDLITGSSIQRKLNRMEFKNWDTTTRKLNRRTTTTNSSTTNRSRWLYKVRRPFFTKLRFIDLICPLRQFIPENTGLREEQ